MTKDNKFVYTFEVDYDTTIGGDKLHSHNLVAIYENIDDAIKAAMMNCDSDLTEQDISDDLENEGYCEIWWHPMIVGDNFAKHVVATITEHVLTPSNKGS